ncbi:hypothetical protein, partial [Devosia enhydra]|uniref:hypothetical protein n=1 Tax=Devosia enhydra TaxID=665118 RepID=UPI001AECDFCB
RDRTIIHAITAWLLIGQIKKNQNSRGALSLPGVRVKQAASHLFTMSKDPDASPLNRDEQHPNLLSEPSDKNKQ